MAWIFHQPAALIWFVDVPHIPTQSCPPPPSNSLKRMWFSTFSPPSSPHHQSLWLTTASEVILLPPGPRYLIYSMIFLPPCCWWCLLSVADYECLKWLTALMSLIWCNGQSFSRLRRYISTEGLFVGDLGCDSACMPERMCVCVFVLHKCQRESARCNGVFHFVIAECQTFTS